MSQKRNKKVNICKRGKTCFLLRRVFSSLPLPLSLSHLHWLFKTLEGSSYLFYNWVTKLSLLWMRNSVSYKNSKRSFLYRNLYTKKHNNDIKLNQNRNWDNSSIMYSWNPMLNLEENLSQVSLVEVCIWWCL